MPTTGYQAGIDSGDVRLAYGLESVWGNLPAVAFQELRMSNEAFNQTKNRARPPELRPDWQAAHGVTTGVDTVGQINFALSYGTYDDLLAAMLNGAWTTALNINSVDGDMSTEATGNKLTSTTTGKFDNVQVGQFIRLHGFGAASGFYRVAAKNGAGDELTLDHGTVVDNTPTGTTGAVRGSMLRNGQTFQSLFMQKQLAADKFLTYPGAYATQMSLNVALGAYFTGSFNFIAKDEIPESTNQSTGSVLAAPSTNVVSSVEGWQLLMLDGEEIDAVAQSWGIELTKQGARAQRGLGSAATKGIGRGTLTGEGNLSIFFKDFELYNLYKAEADHMIALRVGDLLGNAYIISAPAAVLLNPQNQTPDQDNDVLSNFDVELNPSTSLGCTIQVDRFNAAAS
jgi:hypothetical protein